MRYYFWAITRRSSALVQKEERSRFRRSSGRLKFGRNSLPHRCSEPNPGSGVSTVVTMPQRQHKLIMSPASLGPCESSPSSSCSRSHSPISFSSGDSRRTNIPDPSSTWKRSRIQHIRYTVLRASSRSSGCTRCVSILSSNGPHTHTNRSYDRSSRTLISVLPPWALTRTSPSTWFQ